MVQDQIKASVTRRTVMASGVKNAWGADEEDRDEQPGAGGGESEPESESDLSPSDVEETSWCANA